MPSSWQGWIALALYGLAIGIVVGNAWLHDYTSSDLLMSFVALVVPLTLAYVFLSYLSSDE